MTAVRTGRRVVAVDVETPGADLARRSAPPGSEFLDAAAEIASRICRDAIWSKDRCTWVAPTIEPIGPSWRPVYRAMGPDLYTGGAGVGLFLAHAASATGEAILQRAALGALRNAAARAGDIPPPLRISLYSGAIGVAHALVQAAEALQDGALGAEGIKIARWAVAPESEISGLDVLSGCAGGIQGLLWLAAREPDGGWIIDAAVRMGDHLLEKASRAGIGWSWDTMGGQPGLATANLNGYSHGAAGIGLALLELGAATGEERFAEAAEQAFLYEASNFDSAAGNWPDFRDPAMGGRAPAAPPGVTPGPSFMTAWCHGAPGIGLSRLRAWKLTGASARREEAMAAIATTRRQFEATSPVFASSCCLCHGDCGNAELLLYAAEVLNDPSLRLEGERIGAANLARYRGAGSSWPCGLQGCGESASLMLGLAGIGLFYLRLHDGAKTPSVVILTPADAPGRGRA
jgi:lantibiotic biosynthesis protein